MERSLELYGYFEGSLDSEYVEDLFFEFLKDRDLNFFGLSFFDDDNFLLDLNGELFGRDLDDVELYGEFTVFCQRHNLRFVEVVKRH